jgi:hypothetical protein
MAASAQYDSRSSRVVGGKVVGMYGGGLALVMVMGEEEVGVVGSGPKMTDRRHNTDKVITICVSEQSHYSLLR